MALFKASRLLALSVAVVLSGWPLGASAASAPAAESPATIVTLTFHDGHRSHDEYAREVLNDHDVDASFYVATGWADAAANGYMAPWQLDRLYRDGHEIGGMGRDHKNLTQTYDADPAADLAFKRAQVCDDRARLVELGYDPQTFAWVQGARNASTDQIVAECGYRAARGAGGLSATSPPYAETNPPANPYHVRTGNLPGGPISLASLQQSVTAAATNGGGWLPFAFNKVCRQGSADYATCMNSNKPIDDAVLGSFLAWLNDGAPEGVSTATVRSVMGAPPQPPLPPRNTVVSLTFDDGLSSQYRARSVLAPYDAKGTYFLNSGAIDARERGVVTWKQARNLAAAGHEIGGHTLDHVSIKGMPYAEARRQVCDDRSRLMAEGFDPVSFAYPTAAFDTQAEQIVETCGYQSGRTGGSVLTTGPNYAESLPPRNIYSTRALGTTYNGPISLAWLQDAVEGAASHGGGWVQVLFHQVCFAGDDYAGCMARYRPVDAAVLDAFLAWLETDDAPAGVSVQTVADALS